MSQENVEIVRRAHERLNEGDINGLIALCDGDFELDMSARTMNPETYRGHGGIRRFYREVSEVWEDFRWEPLRFCGGADKVAVLLHSHGRGRGSGLEMARDAAMVWTVREDRAVSVRFYIDQAEALEAAGLSEWAMDHLSRMPIAAAIGFGAVIGLALGVVVSLTTNVPLAPEVGVVLGGLVGWLLGRDRE